jgi:hypothetical protein
MYTRRTDLIGFVNGIPLIFIELKASRERVELPTKTTSATTEKKSPTVLVQRHRHALQLCRKYANRITQRSLYRLHGYSPTHAVSGVFDG